MSFFRRPIWKSIGGGVALWNGTRISGPLLPHALRYVHKRNATRRAGECWFSMLKGDGSSRNTRAEGRWTFGF